MNYHASFTPGTLPAAAATITAQPYAALTFPMPAVDGGNQDVMVFNAGAGPVYLNFAANAPAGPTVPGCVVVPGGEAVLLTATQATLGVMQNNPLVMGGGQAIAAEAATAVSCASHQMPSTVTITRGTATARAVWNG